MGMQVTLPPILRYGPSVMMLNIAAMARKITVVLELSEFRFKNQISSFPEKRLSKTKLIGKETNAKVRENSLQKIISGLLVFGCSRNQKTCWELIKLAVVY